MKITIICDNGGGITLQIRQRGYRYQHMYYDPIQAAHDIHVAHNPGCDLHDWDGNDLVAGDPAEWLYPSDDDVRNGGYRVYYDPDDIPATSSWRNVRELAAALHAPDKPARS